MPNMLGVESRFGADQLSGTAAVNRLQLIHVFNMYDMEWGSWWKG
jgi:hypothetical protein